MLNKTQLQGRLTADPELRETNTGVSVCSFSIAVERNYTDSNETRPCDFINVVAWKGTAELVCKYWSKGDPILLEGSIQVRSYEDKEGNKRNAFEVVANQVFFVGGKRENTDESGNDEVTEQPKKKKGVASKPQKKAKSKPSIEYEEIDDDDLPF